VAVSAAAASEKPLANQTKIATDKKHVKKLRLIKREIAPQVARRLGVKSIGTNRINQRAEFKKACLMQVI
jgi:hypothetical protein